jgi:hypothetical protein
LVNTAFFQQMMLGRCLSGIANEKERVRVIKES